MMQRPRAALLVVIAAAALLLTACVPSPGPAQTSNPPTPEPTIAGPVGCTVDQLDAELRFPDGAAGTLHFELWFDNVGDVACTLVGTPGLIVVDGSGSQLGEPANRTIDDAAPAFTLEPGGSVVTEFQETNIAGGGGPLGDECGEVDGAGYRVFLPDSEDFIFVAEPGFPACTSGQPWMSIDGPLHAPA
ncbi:MAG: DUF4232 domain-containing protein [Pseudolysinimonas sp.]